MTAERKWFRFECHSKVAVVQTSAASELNLATPSPMAQAYGAAYYTHSSENQNEINHRRDGRPYRSRQDRAGARIDRHRCSSFAGREAARHHDRHWIR